MKPTPDQSIWDSELEALAIVLYRAINRHGRDTTWKQEPHFVQSTYMQAALAARTHMTNTTQENR